MKKYFNKTTIVDVIRFYLAVVFFIYGKNKLLNNQFTAIPDISNSMVKNVSKLDIGWFVFGNEPFNYFIAVSELVTCVLLVYRRTILLGAIFFFIIILNILIIDLTLMSDWVKLKMVSKVIYLMFLDLVIVYFYREKIYNALNGLLINIKTQYKLNWKYMIYVFLSIILLNCFSIFPKYFYLIFSNPDKIFDILKFDLQESYTQFSNIFKRYL